MRASDLTINECGIILLDKTFENVLIIFQKESLKWGLPKGHLELKEKTNNLYYQCAKRELLEETGIMINNHKHKKINTFVIRDKLFYVLQLLKDISLYKPLDTKEIGDIRWLPIKDLFNFLETKNCNITLRELYRYLSSKVHLTRHMISNE